MVVTPPNDFLLARFPGQQSHQFSAGIKVTPACQRNSSPVMSTPCPHALKYQLKEIFLERNKASFSNSENFRKFVNPEINEINSPLDLDEK